MSTREQLDPPANWETTIDTRRLGDFPRLAHRNLDVWADGEDRRLDALAAAATTLSIDDITASILPHVGPDIGIMEREIIAGLALSLWGAEHVGAAVQRKRERDSGRCAFGGLNSALAFVTGRAPVLGQGSLTMHVAESKQNPNPARIGYDYCAAKQSSNGASKARGIDALELREDVQRALASAGVSACDRWLVEVTTLGSEYEVKQGPEGTATVVRVKWKKEQGGQPGERAKLSRREAAEILHLEATRILGLIRAMRTGTTPLPPAEEARVMAIRSRVLDDSVASDEAVSERITRARKALAAALVAHGLIPAPEVEKAPRKASDAPRHPPVRWDSAEAFQ